MVLYILQSISDVSFQDHKMQHNKNDSLQHSLFLCVVYQSEASPVFNDSVMSGFLRYGDNPKTWQREWTVIPRAEPPVLSLYAVPQVGIFVIRKCILLQNVFCKYTVAFYFQALSTEERQTLR